MDFGEIEGTVAMKKWSIFLLFVVAIGAFLWGYPLHSKNMDKNVYDVYLACDNGQDTITYMYLHKFGEILEAKSNGRIRPHYYSDAQVGGDVELLEGIENGNVTFVTQNSAPQVNFIPEAAVFDIPLLFSSEKVAREVLNPKGLVFSKLKTAYAAKDIDLLGITDQSFRQLTTNRKIEKLDDLKGLKVRTMENRYHMAFWKALGVNPTPMTFSEVYIGLQQGIIDGQENPLETIVSSRVYEQQKYLVNINYIYHTVILIGSSKFINSLPLDLQKIITEAADEASQWADNQSDKRLASRYQIVSEAGTIIIPFNQVLFDSMKPYRDGVVRMIEQSIGPELPELIIEEANRVSKNSSQ